MRGAGHVVGNDLFIVSGIFSTSVTELDLGYAVAPIEVVQELVALPPERIHEIGIMSANGVRPKEIRWMLYLESVFMVLIGCALGGIIAMLMIGYWQTFGLDLSGFSEGLNAMGISSTIYPQLNWEQVGLGFAAILVMVLLAVLYPAIKASRFEAVDAINYV